MIAKVTMVESVWASFEAPQAATFKENLRDILCNIIGHVKDFNTVARAPGNEGSLNNNVPNPAAEIEESHARFETYDIDHFGDESAIYLFKYGQFFSGKGNTHPQLSSPYVVEENALSLRVISFTRGPADR